MIVLAIIAIVLFAISTIGFVISLVKNIVKKDYNMCPIAWCVAVNFFSMLLKIINTVRK